MKNIKKTQLNIQSHHLKFNVITQVKVLSKMFLTWEASRWISEMLTKVSSFSASECLNTVVLLVKIHYRYGFKASPRVFKHWRLEITFPLIRHSFFSTTHWSKGCRCPWRTLGVGFLLPWGISELQPHGWLGVGARIATRVLRPKSPLFPSTPGSCCPVVEIGCSCRPRPGPNHRQRVAHSPPPSQEEGSCGRLRPGTPEAASLSPFAFALKQLCLLWTDEETQLASFF